MARKPVDKLNAIETREAIWGVVRQFSFKGAAFTARDVRMETCCSTGQVGDYLRGLLAAGIIGLEDHNPDALPGTPNRYRLLTDAGAEAPRVRRDGSKVTQGTGRRQMWRAMRVLKTFSLLDLKVHAATNEHQVAIGEVKAYCQALARAKYLVRRDDLYIQVRYTGPRPPMIQRNKQVYDPNLQQVVWPLGGNDDNR